MGASKITTIVLISIILTAVLVSVVNVGMSIFMERPSYGDYCDVNLPKVETNSTGDIVDADYTCHDDYEKAIQNYNQWRFYIFAGIGFILMLLGLFIPEIITKVVGLGAGGIMVIEGIVMNLQNKWAVFISLLAILVIFGVLGVRVVKKMKD